jgi:hypothetical protein
VRDQCGHVAFDSLGRSRSLEVIGQPDGHGVARGEVMKRAIHERFDPPFRSIGRPAGGAGHDGLPLRVALVFSFTAVFAPRTRIAADNDRNPPVSLIDP